MLKKALLKSDNKVIHVMPLKNGNYWCMQSLKEYSPIEIDFNNASISNNITQAARKELRTTQHKLPGQLSVSEWLQNLCC